MILIALFLLYLIFVAYLMYVMASNNRAAQPSLVKDRIFWAPVLSSIPITIFCFFLSAGAAGVGHGSSMPFVICFPYATAILSLAERVGPGGPLDRGPIGLLLLFPLVFQYPLYGFLIGIAIRKGKFIRAAAVIVATHLALAGFVFYRLF